MRCKATTGSHTNELRASDTKPDQDRLTSKPLRNWLLAWHIHTGDPPDVIAKGFDLELETILFLLRCEMSTLEVRLALAICERLRMSPAALWPEAGIALDAPMIGYDHPHSDVPPHLADALLTAVSGNGKRVSDLPMTEPAAD